MARADLLINLVKAGVNGDQQLAQRTAEAIVAEERAKQHSVLADRLERVMRTPNGNGGRKMPLALFPEAPPSRGKDFVSETIPRRNIGDLILPDITACAIRQLIEE